MNHKTFIIALALLALTACQGNTTASEEDDTTLASQTFDKPLNSLDLSRMGYEHQAETRKELRDSDDVFIPKGTPVAISGFCKIARDVPLFAIQWPDDAAHEFKGKNGYFSAHLENNKEVAQMKEGQKYLVKGRIGHGETMCYGSYFIDVDSFTAID